MTRAFRPMKGEEIEEHHLNQLTYPMLVSPKMDGIRGAVMIGGAGVYSNNIKLLKSTAVQKIYGIPEMQGLDGELIVGPVGAPNVFNRTTSFVGSFHKPYPEDGLHFYVFDDFTDPNIPYFQRYERVKARVEELTAGGIPNLRVTPQHPVFSKKDVLELEEMYLAGGLEGIMIRSGEARYKYGRGTIREQMLLKFKRFTDDECRIVGAEELYSNQNEATVDARGLTTRSSHQDNQVPMDTLGALVCESVKFEEQFKIGTGFTAAQRAEIWAMHKAGELVGKIGNYSYQAVGVLNKPRFPKWRDFRIDV